MIDYKPREFKEWNPNSILLNVLILGISGFIIAISILHL